MKRQNIYACRLLLKSSKMHKFHDNTSLANKSLRQLANDTAKRICSERMKYSPKR